MGPVCVQEINDLCCGNVIPEATFPSLCTVTTLSDGVILSSPELAHQAGCRVQVPLQNAILGKKRYGFRNLPTERQHEASRCPHFEP
ncbi:hypothetical protein D3C87_1468900 [compost metagenome]